MSTRIYYGWRTPTTSLSKVFDRLRAFQPIAQAHLAVSYATTLRNIANSNPAQPEAPATDIPFFNAQEQLDAHIKTVSEVMGYLPKHLTFHLDIAFACTPKSNHTLGITLNHPDLHRLWIQQPNIQEYGYWNNTDKPDELTSRQWASRKKAWDFIGYEPIPQQMAIFRIEPPLTLLMKTYENPHTAA